jgi:hypothetical protein
MQCMTKMKEIEREKNKLFNMFDVCNTIIMMSFAVHFYAMVVSDL